MKKMTRKIAAILAAVMTMTTAAAMSVSADNTDDQQTETKQEFVTDNTTSAKATIKGNGSVSGETGTNTSNPDMTVRGEYSSIYLVSRKDENIYLKAVADEGWTFVRWINANTGKTYSKKKNITIKAGTSADLIAEFKIIKNIQPEIEPEVQPEAEENKEAEAPEQKGTWIIDQIDIDEIIKILPLDIF